MKKFINLSNIHRMLMSLINNTFMFGVLFLVSCSRFTFALMIVVIVTILGNTIEAIQVGSPNNVLRYYNDRSSKQILIFTQAIFLAVAMHFISYQNSSLFINCLGIFLVFLGLAIRIYSIRTLGINFHSTVSITPENNLIKHGIYRWVRHPCYLGIFILTLGYVVLTNFSLVVMICAILVVLAVFYRTKVEEMSLESYFGTEYSQYIKITKRFIPYLY